MVRRVQIEPVTGERTGEHGGIGSRAAIDHVIAGTPCDGVVARTAGDGIILVAAGDRVVAVARVEGRSRIVADRCGGGVRKRHRIVAAEGVEDRARRVIGHVGDRVEIDRIGVVAEQPVVDPGDNDRRGRRAGTAVAVADRVVEAVDQLLAVVEVLQRGRGGGIVGERAVGVEGHRGPVGRYESADRSHRQAVAGIGIAVGAVAIVGQDVAGDRRVLVGGEGIVRRRRRIVAARDGDGHGCRAGGAGDIRNGVGHRDHGGLVDGQFVEVTAGIKHKLVSDDTDAAARCRA